MSYYTYCVVRLDPDESWEVFPGIGDRPVYPVRDQRMAVLVSRLERPQLENARSVVQHGHVIHRAFERHTVLPFRYGTVFKTQHQVEALLRENRDQFTEAIRFLRGKAEMHVKMLFRQAAERPRAMAAAASLLPAAASVCQSQEVGLNGTGELQARRLAQRLTEALCPLQEQVSLRLSREGQVLMDLRHLVEEERLETYQRVSALTAERMKECHVQVTGPWPPYHFLPVAVKLPARSERLLRTGVRVPLRARGAR